MAVSYEDYNYDAEVIMDENPDVHPSLLAAVARRADAAGLSTDPDCLREDLRYWKQKGLMTTPRGVLARTVELASSDND